MTDHTNRNADRVLVAVDIAKQSHDALILWPSGKKQAVVRKKSCSLGCQAIFMV